MGTVSFTHDLSVELEQEMEMEMEAEATCTEPTPPAAIHNFRRNPSPLARSLASVDPQDKICSDPLSLYPSDDLLPPSASSIPSPQPQSSAAASE